MGKLSWLFRAIFALWFRISVKGEVHQNKQTFFIANHVSHIDSLLLALFIPKPLTFFLNKSVNKNVGLRMLTWFAEVIYVDLSEPFDQQRVLNEIHKGKSCVLFPEEYKKNKGGFECCGLILQRSQVDILPIRIEGAKQSIFTHTKGKTMPRLCPKITLDIMDKLTLTTSDNPESQTLGKTLFLLFSQMAFVNSNKDNSLFKTMLEGAYKARKFPGWLQDQNRKPLSSNQFITRCFILGKQFSMETQPGDIVGLMLPTTIAGMVSFFALQAYRRIPALLNFSSGFYNLYSACETAGIKIIYTSRQFIETAKLEALVNELELAGLKFRFLEDFTHRINRAAKLSGLLKGFLPHLAYWFIGKAVKPEQRAVILFTSGSEGVPKGVALTHRNILSNCSQMISRVDFSAEDIFFNALPIFHCFGLTAGSLIPLFTGNRCFLYPSPLHYKIIPKLVHESLATIFFATDTFLTGYARAAAPDDFNSLRYIFAGAEKVKPETIQRWQEKFGAQIYEGYGATEASPVISLNCPFANKLGSVGLPVPNLKYRIEPVDGIKEGGRLFISGPNVISGYLGSPNEALESGWYDTGDIVYIDEEGFIFIKGRAKRFAKLAGEMISLAAVESIAALLWPEQLHAALSRKSLHKGEQIILFSEHANADKTAFIQHAKSHGQSELLIPQIIFSNVQIPVLASGKIDYPCLERNLASFFPEPPTANYL